VETTDYNIFLQSLYSIGGSRFWGQAIYY